MRKIISLIFILVLSFLYFQKQSLAVCISITSCNPANDCNCGSAVKTQSFTVTLQQALDKNYLISQAQGIIRACPYIQCYSIGSCADFNGATVEVSCYPSKGGGGTGPCMGMKDPELTKCEQCVGNKPPPVPDPMNGKKGVWTALGCVNTKPEDFVAQLLGWVIGLGGGIAFLLIVWGGFQIVTSSGDPEKLNSGKEIIVSALTGLLMIIFSVILLRIIGVNILKIPGL